MKWSFGDSDRKQEDGQNGGGEKRESLCGREETLITFIPIFSSIQVHNNNKLHPKLQTATHGDIQTRLLFTKNTLN